MGSGKSSVGRLVAASAQQDFVDCDDLVTERIGEPISEFWARQGEEAFRAEESAVIAELASGPGRVVATGGGAVLRGSNVENMRSSGTVIWLQATVETLANRVGNSNRRPLLQGEDVAAKLGRLLEERSASYMAAAHATVATDGLELETVALRIEELWNAY